MNDPDPPPQPSSEIAQLVLYLCIYRVQLYPIWPIIKVERLIASLQSESPDVEVFALAYALAAATATRTESIDLSISRRNHAQLLEGKCQAARARVPMGRPPNLTTVRIALFLHIYYESLEANSMKSMLYLREAVTIATMIGLHKESYYVEVPYQEREIRRRVLWLLFVTERMISILYEQPITLRTRIELPSTTDTDEVDVLAGFQLLVKLLWRLDENNFFTMLEELEVQASPASTGHSGRTPNLSSDCTALIQTDADYSGYIPPVQALDLAVTRCWLHIMNLRIRQSVTADCLTDHLRATLLSALEDMVQAVENSPRKLVEAHGFALQLKISTISGALHELVAAHYGPTSYPDTHSRFADLAERLGQAFSVRTDQTATLFAATPASAVRGSPHTAVNTPSPKLATGVPSRHQSQPFTSNVYGRAPGNNDTLRDLMNERSPASQYLTQDFALSNNYDGLFDAVELVGLHTSDSMNDFFGRDSSEHYSNSEDTWPELEGPSGVTNTMYRLQSHQGPLFGFE